VVRLQPCGGEGRELGVGGPCSVGLGATSCSVGLKDAVKKALFPRHYPRPAGDLRRQHHARFLQKGEGLEGKRLFPLGQEALRGQPGGKENPGGKAERLEFAYGVQGTLRA
jgi:hypothetical protein